MRHLSTARSSAFASSRTYLLLTREDPSLGTAYVDWGLPFFFGRKVFFAIEEASAPGGASPYVAY